MSDVEFELYEYSTEEEDADVVKVKYAGVWIMVDNGYIRWPTTMPPHKICSKYSEIRWAQWLESMRKDVECTFGIMKGRFRILKTGIRVHGVEVVDKIW